LATPEERRRYDLREIILRSKPEKKSAPFQRLPPSSPARAHRRFAAKVAEP
jgi:hypothetical protein